MGRTQGELLPQPTGWTVSDEGCPALAEHPRRAGREFQCHGEQNVPGLAKEVLGLQGRNRKRFQEISRWRVEAGDLLPTLRA